MKLRKSPGSAWRPRRADCVMLSTNCAKRLSRFDEAKVSDPIEDRMLEEYLHRKSAISMGYRRIYVEAPSPELDRTVTARARRALRWLVPGAIATLIAIVLIFAVNFTVTKYMSLLVNAQKSMERMDAERQKKEEEERARQPVSVIVDPSQLQQSDARPSREQWLAKIDALKRAGKQAEAQAELKKFRAAYPSDKTDSKN